MTQRAEAEPKTAPKPPRNQDLAHCPPPLHGPSSHGTYIPPRTKRFPPGTLAFPSPSSPKNDRPISSTTHAMCRRLPPPDVVLDAVLGDGFRVAGVRRVEDCRLDYGQMPRKQSPEKNKAVGRIEDRIRYHSIRLTPADGASRAFPDRDDRMRTIYHLVSDRALRVLAGAVSHREERDFRHRSRESGSGSGGGGQTGIHFECDSAAHLKPGAQTRREDGGWIGASLTGFY